MRLASTDCVKGFFSSFVIETSGRVTTYVVELEI